MSRLLSGKQQLNMKNTRSFNNTKAYTNRLSLDFFSSSLGSLIKKSGARLHKSKLFTFFKTACSRSGKKAESVSRTDQQKKHSRFSYYDRQKDRRCRECSCSLHWLCTVHSRVHGAETTFDDLTSYRKFYVTDGNIMYLTDASRFLISCVIQHYAPVVVVQDGMFLVVKYHIIRPPPACLGQAVK